MEIRLAKPSDSKELAEMRWDFQLEEPSETSSIEKQEFVSICTKFLEDKLSSQQWKCWIALNNSKIIAHVFLQKIDLVPKPQNLNIKQFGYVTNTYTKPDFRNQGVGKKLIEQLVSQAKVEGLETLIVWPSEKSIEFYKRAGFTDKNEVLELNLID